MAGTQGTQGTRATGYIPDEPTKEQAGPAPVRLGYRPPSTPLALGKDQLDYRAELIKSIVKLKEDDQAWHEGIMDTWSTQKIAIAGLDTKLTAALIGNAGQGYIATAMTEEAKAQAMKLKNDFLEHSASAKYFNPDADAVKRYVTGIGDADTQLGNAVNSAAGHRELDRIEAETSKLPESDRKAAKLAMLGEYLDTQGKMDQSKKNAATVIDGLPDTTKVDTLLDISMRRKTAVQGALGDDERFAELLPEYFAHTDQAYIDAAHIKTEQIQAGQERHAAAAEDESKYEKQLDSLEQRFGLPKETKQAVMNAISGYHKALGGDPIELHNLAMSVPTPPELQQGLDMLEGELARQDSKPNADRDAFIRAFNQRAGSNDAFYKWSVAMGFRGGRSIDRAAAFAAQYPEMSKPSADAMRADPSLIAPGGDIMKLKAKLREVGEPVGITGPYRVIHPPKPQTPAAALDPNLPGSGGPPGLLPQAPAVDTASAGSLPTPAPAPTPAPIPQPAPVAPVGDQAVGGTQAAPSASKTISPEAGSADSTLDRAAISTAPADVTEPYQVKNHVESRPDGSVVVVRPDGSEMVISGPTPNGVTLSEPAGPPAPVPAGSMTGTPELPTQTIASRLGPAVAPSDVPAQNDVTPYILQSLRAQRGMPQLDENGIPVPVGGR